MMMKLDKKKITFALLMGTVLLFMMAYALMTFGNADGSKEELSQPLVPALETKQDEYTSRLEAVNALKKERESNAPSIYDERLLDPMGVYGPNLLENEKMRMVDSIYNQGRIDYTTMNYRRPDNDGTAFSIAKRPTSKKVGPETKKDTTPLNEWNTKEMDLEQQLFFASEPLSDTPRDKGRTFKAIIDRRQVIKTNDRLEMRVLNDVFINGKHIPKNTVLYGIVSFKPNRVLLKIHNVNDHPMSFKAYDFQDGLEGIYIRNSFRGDIGRQVLGDAIGDVNIPGVPQVQGIKKIFARSNRQVKVAVNPNYKLILAAK